MPTRYSKTRWRTILELVLTAVVSLDMITAQDEQNVLALLWLVMLLIS